jgi:hypothetical protein
MIVFPVFAPADPALLLSLAPRMARAANRIPRPEPRPQLPASLPFPLTRDTPPDTTKAMP